MYISSKKVTILLALLLSAAPFSVAAQDSSCVIALPVTMTLASSLASTVPSTSVGFHAEIKNTGSVVIPDAMMVVDVVRSDLGERTIVDRFVVPQHITLFGNYTAQTDFVWKVPVDLSNGSYTVAMTLAPQAASAAQIFAAVGYPTATTSIVIQGGMQPSASVRLLAINGQPYQPLTIAHISQGGASITATVHNGSSAPYIGTVTWQLYAADAHIGDAPLDQKTDAVELHPGTDTGMIYSLANRTAGAYYLQGQLSNGHETTFFDVLLDSGTAAFGWTSCLHTSAPSAGKHTGRLVVVGSTILLIAIALFAQRRRNRGVSDRG